MATGSAVVIAHNSGEHIEACLEAVQKHAGWEILLIDNASQDDTLERAQRFVPRVRIVANPVNLGFGGAVNQAVSLATTRVVVVMNPDAVPAEGALDRLAEVLRVGDVGAVGGALVDERGHPQQGFVVRRFPRLSDAICEILLINAIWPGNPCNLRYRCLTLDLSRAQEVDQPAGAALAFRYDAWQHVGGFDESFYPVWYEDVDFCQRLRQYGFKVRYEPAAKFYHAGAHSVSRVPFCARQLFWYRNLLRFFEKHHGNNSVRVLRAAIAAGMALRSLACFAGLGQLPVARLEALRTYAQVVRFCVFQRPDASTSRQLPSVPAKR